MYREGYSSACSSWDSKHDECDGIGSLDQDGSQLLCRCPCHDTFTEHKCPTCDGTGKVTRKGHDYPRKVTAVRRTTTDD